jgi:Protein of unknown function (DUF3238)
MRFFRVVTVLSAFTFLCAEAAADDTVQVVIETRILDGDPQAGMKSRQVIQVDFVNKRVKDTFETGTTDFFGVKLSSVRDKFLISEVNFSDGTVTFRAAGETASGVRALPSIDYNLLLTVNADGSTKISGCHDGYPAYSVNVDAKTIYTFKHKSVQLIKLFGSCDIQL